MDRFGATSESEGDHSFSDTSFEGTKKCESNSVSDKQNVDAKDRLDKGRENILYHWPPLHGHRNSVVIQ
uniref:Uncharacterized protein n=1 Tax=Oryctolagus cuniculus TaxID=9986 RepID=A0A5F9DM62_RABIT